MFLAPDTQAFLLVPRFTLLVIGIEVAFAFSSGSVTPPCRSAPWVLKPSPSHENRLALS